MIGKRFGQFEIAARIGSGGMGEVYRALDTRLGRSVAVKMLPEIFAQDPERILRLEREAKVLASLNHPNIAALYGLEEFEKRHFLVMELVEGETLAERIARGPIAVEEALKIAQQIAEALEAAHEKGVIHRDLKPANAKMTPEGKVKVLDFGLAKAMEPAPSNANLSNSPTLSLAGTTPGMILGTAAYMSPEQAKGLAADQRSDVFSFGAVLYEMLTGRQAFQGDNVSEILASVLAREPDLEALPANLNPRIPDLLRRCLEKNAKRRWHAAADMRVEIEAILADPRGTMVQSQPVDAHKPLRKRALPILLAAIICSVISGIAVWNLKPAPPGIVTRFTFALPADQQFVGASYRHVLSISPDGTQFAYAANNRLYLKPMRELNSIYIQGSEDSGGVVSPTFSPDGRSLVFYSIADRTYKRIAVSGGAPVMICPGDYPTGISWGTDNRIVIGQGNKGIMRVSANGGKPEIIATVKEIELAHGPQVLPGGDSILFTLASGSQPDLWDKARIVVQKMTSGERKTLIDGGTDARYLPTGEIIYALSGTLLAVPFDLKRLEVTGGAVSIVEGVRRANPLSGTAHFSFSDTGTLLYIPGTAEDPVQNSLALIDRNGAAKPVGVPPGSFEAPRISPNGKQLAFDSNDGTDYIVYVYELSGASSMRRLTFGGSNRFPIWSGDGDRVLFQSNREGDLGLFWQRADGAGSAERVTKSREGHNQVPMSWAPTGEKFAFFEWSGNAGGLWIYSLHEKKASPFSDVPSDSMRSEASFSPDGLWLAYQSNETGRYEVYVQPFPATGAKYQITKGGPTDNHHPLWSPVGKELFYVSGRRLFSVAIKTQPSFTFANAVPLPINGFQPVVAGTRNYDVTPDGKRFVVVFLPGQNAAEPRPALQIQVVLNWFEELKQRMSRQ